MVKEDCCELSGFTPQAAGGGVEEYEIGEREREKGKELHQSQDDALSMFFFFSTWKSPDWSGCLLNYSEKT